MLRRTMLAGCFFAPLVGCGNTVNVPIDVKTIAEAVTGALLKFAPPALGAKLQAAYAARQAGGDWKVTARAFLDVADQIIATGLVPAQYAALATTALAGLRILLGFVAAGPNAVTMSQARDAAAQLKALR